MIIGGSRQNLPPVIGFKSLFLAELLLILSFPAAKINIILVPILFIFRVILKVRGLFGMQKRAEGFKTAGKFFVLSMMAWTVDYTGTGIVKIIAEVVGLLFDFFVVYFVCKTAVEILMTNNFAYLACLAPKISRLYLIGSVAAFFSLLLTKVLDAGLFGSIVYYAASAVSFCISVLFAGFLYQIFRSFRNQTLNKS